MTHEEAVSIRYATFDAFAIWFRLWWGREPTAREVWLYLATRTSEAPAPTTQQRAEPAADERADSLEFRLRDAIKGMGNCIADPMWSGHVEVSKANLKRWHKLLHDIRAAQSGQREVVTDEHRAALLFLLEMPEAVPVADVLKATGTVRTLIDYYKGLIEWKAGQRAGVAEDAMDAVRAALPEFSQQDDYLLAHGASLMSDSSHEIIHVDTLKRIIAAVQGTPDGWQLVPKEPTEEMLRAADEGDREYSVRNFGDGVVVQQGPYDHWVAMLAAAPTQQQEGGS